jgi:hypothetical protein
MVYQTLDPLRPVVRMRVARALPAGRQAAGEVWCWVTGVDPEGRWVPAQACKITDSGAGVAYLVTGGGWGLRFAPGEGSPRWDLHDPAQWGEPYKIYGEPTDLAFAGTLPA